MSLIPSGIVQATLEEPRVLVLYGRPKVGKTTALAQLPGNLLLGTEEGLSYVSARKLECTKDTWDDVILELRALSNTPPFVTLDTVDMLEEWCEGWATELYESLPMGKNFDLPSVLAIERGGGYYWLRKVFKEKLTELRIASNRLIIVSHTRDKLLGGKDEKNDRVVRDGDLSLTGKIREMVCAAADAIGYVYRADGRLMVSFLTSEDLNVGSRVAHLAGKTMPLEWKMIYPQTLKNH